MARVIELLNISGSVNNLVFYQRNGVNYVRTKPSFHHDAKTEKQLTYRGRFAGCNRFYDQIKVPIFRQVWKTMALGTGKNAKNVFMQHTIYAFGKEQKIIDYGRLRFSAGLLPLPNRLQIECQNKRDCLLQWEYDPTEAIGAANDRLYVVELITKPDAYDVQIHETKVCRNEGKALFSTFHDIDDQTHLYCFWGNESQTSFSDSYYLDDIKLIAP